MRIGCGILAVWNDCASSDEEAYEAWYLSEHLVERLSIPGFCWGRRYRRLAGSSGALPEYMTYYETDTPEVLTSDAYLARVNDPTPETHRIMTSVFKNMNRTICRRVAGTGAIRTTHVVAVVSFGGDLPDLNAPTSPSIPTLWRESWSSAEPQGQPVSREEQLRGQDAKIRSCHLFDCHTSAQALALAAQYGAMSGVAVAAYELTGSLHASDLPLT